jgi:AcrR family transcriptional regulator
MTKRDDKRRQITEQAADYLLTNGLSNFTLRTLGAAIGTSDRMLLHYFDDKDELLTRTLDLAITRLFTLLGAIDPGLMSQAELTRFLVGVLDNAAIVPFNKLWLELAALAYRDGEPYRAMAARTADTVIGWIEAHLQSDAAVKKRDAVAAVMMVVEGTLFLNAIGKSDLVKRAIAIKAR